MAHVVHIFLSVLLFFLINWFGKRLKSSGYKSLSVFVERDEAPAFNFLFRVLGPLVFIVVAAASFYSIDQDHLVSGIWRVVVYHLVFRLTFNLARGRALLLNWAQEVLIWFASIGGSWLLYENVIQVRRYLLPDPQSMTNELWVVVILFIYAALNNIELGSEGTERRKKRYLKHKYSKLRSEYDEIIQEVTPDRFAESIIYTVMIYEDFNRPPLARYIEYILFPYFSQTLGPMQVTTATRINDRQSVRMGAERIVDSYSEALEEKDHGDEIRKLSKFNVYSVVRSVSSDYNKDDSYVSDRRKCKLS